MPQSPVPFAAGSCRSFISCLSQVSAVRAFISTMTGGHDTAVLLGSELAANAVLHGLPLPNGMFTVTVTATATEVLVSVRDGGPRGQTLIPRQPGECRRGLVIVDALSVRHGLDTDNGGSVAWFRLALAA